MSAHFSTTRRIWISTACIVLGATWMATRGHAETETETRLESKQESPTGRTNIAGLSWHTDYH